MTKDNLIEFGKEIVTIFREVNVEPVLYGSLLYSYYIKKKVKINDIDFYVPEKSFEKIVRLLQERKMNHNYLPKWHTLQIFKGKLKIEIDSIDYWYSGPRDFVNFNLDDLKIKALSLAGLKSIYKKAAETSKDNPEGNLKKFNVLKLIK